jgi:hypothetical protein
MVKSVFQKRRDLVDKTKISQVQEIITFHLQLESITCIIKTNERNNKMFYFYFLIR